MNEFSTMTRRKPVHKNSEMYTNGTILCRIYYIKTIFYIIIEYLNIIIIKKQYTVVHSDTKKRWVDISL